METTNYFRQDVMVKRPYIKKEWLELALAQPVRREVQPEDDRSVQVGYGPVCAKNFGLSWG